MNKLYQRARKNKQQAINFAFIIFTHVATNYFKRVPQMGTPVPIPKKPCLQDCILSKNIWSIKQWKRGKKSLQMFLYLSTKYLVQCVPNIWNDICHQISCTIFVSWLTGWQTPFSAPKSLPHFLSDQTIRGGWEVLKKN